MAHPRVVDLDACERHVRRQVDRQTMHPRDARAGWVERDLPMLPIDERGKVREEVVSAERVIARDVRGDERRHAVKRVLSYFETGYLGLPVHVGASVRRELEGAGFSRKMRLLGEPGRDDDRRRPRVEHACCPHAVDRDGNGRPRGVFAACDDNRSRCRGAARVPRHRGDPCADT